MSDEYGAIDDRTMRELATTSPVDESERCPHSNRPGAIRAAGCSQCLEARPRVPVFRGSVDNLIDERATAKRARAKERARRLVEPVTKQNAPVYGK